MLFLRQLMPTFHNHVNAPIDIYNDNQSSLTLVNGNRGSFHGRMKHYDIKLAHLHKSIDNGQVCLSYRQTNNMPANLLTKPLCCVKLQHLLKLLNMTNVPVIK